MRNFIISPDEVTEGSIELSGSDARHIRTVLRMKPNDEIIVSAGAKGRYRCKIESVGETISVAILEKIPTDENKLPVITLYQSIAKGKKMDNIVRMICELGVVNMIPVITERCDVKLKPGEESVARKLDRWRAIAKSAAKQSGQIAATTIALPVVIEKVEADHESLNIVFWEEETASLKAILTDSDTPTSTPLSVSLLVGPEGGLTEDEVETLREKGFVSASLGQSILRTETAPVAAVAAVMFWYGE